MGIIRKTLALTGWSTLGATAGYVLWTRKSRIESIPQDDYIFNATLYRRYNPNDSPVTQDVCIRKVPLDKIKPELLEKEGKLVEAFCAGVWGGLGYAYQRSYLEKKYRADEYTKDHLWDRKELKSASYDVGTKITDHFEVMAKSPTSIIVRCGDSPRKQELRPSDGLFEMVAEVNKKSSEVEFRLKSIFYNGLGAQPDEDGKPPSGPMSPWIQWLHQQYDKVWMETAITNCTR